MCSTFIWPKDKVALNMLIKTIADNECRYFIVFVDDGDLVTKPLTNFYPKSVGGGDKREGIKPYAKSGDEILYEKI